MVRTHSDNTTAILALLLAVTCYFALFWRLDGAYLWRDETTTANWARTMARDNSLVPLVFDGKTLAVQGFDAHDFNDHLTPGMQGWLQFYVAAISFKLLGVSTLTARLPFAILGLVSVWVMWLIGRRLYPSGNLAFLFPFLAVTSCWFLTAARQARYYGLVFLFGTLVMYEFIRYLQERELASKSGWYIRIAFWCAGVYLSNYLAFAGLYTALCIFVLLMRDRTLFFRWCALTGILGLLFGVEFFSFHFDFASMWGSAAQPWEDANASIWDKLQIARNMHEEELFQMFPLVVLIPGLFYIALRGKRGEEGARVPMWVAAICAGLVLVQVALKGMNSLTLFAIAVAFGLAAAALRLFTLMRKGSPDADRRKQALKFLVPLLLGAMISFGFAVTHTSEHALLYLCAEILVAGLLVFAILRLRPVEGEAFPMVNAVVLLLTLIMIITIFVTIGVGLDKGIPRYYYHVLAAGEILAALVTAELFRRKQKAVAVIFLSIFLIWPNITWYVLSSFGIVGRQFEKNRTIDYPVVEYLREHAKAGDKFVVYRNVQGMMIHFYLPELQWVGQLDSTNERALYFKDRLPASAYDDVADVDWYAVWDNYGRMPLGLDDRYEKVWEYTYRYPMPWWDSKRGAVDQRTWRLYKRTAKASEGSTAGGGDTSTTP